MSHTPTPWHFINEPIENERPFLTIMGPRRDGSDGSDSLNQILYMSLQPDFVLANARLIVTAVNHHAAMIELLSECFDQLGGMDGQVELRARIMATLASVKDASDD